MARRARKLPPLLHEDLPLEKPPHIVSRVFNPLPRPLDALPPIVPKALKPNRASRADGRAIPPNRHCAAIGKLRPPRIEPLDGSAVEHALLFRRRLPFKIRRDPPAALAEHLLLTVIDQRPHSILNIIAISAFSFY